MERSRSRNSLSAAEREASAKALALQAYVQNALSARRGPSYINFVKEITALRRKVADATAALTTAQPRTDEDVAAEFSLVALLQAVKASVSHFRPGQHDSLLGALLSISLWQCNSAVRVALVELCVELIASNAAFVPNCLQMLLLNLLPPPGTPEPKPACEPGAAWQPRPLELEVQNAIVAALEQAVQLVPAVASRLLPLMLGAMPHRGRDRCAQCLYISAVLRLCEGHVSPALREGLLRGVVEHLLAIDADIRWEEIVDGPTACEHDDGPGGESDDELFDLEGLVDLDINPYGAGGPGGGHTAASAAVAAQLAVLQDGFHDPAAFAAAANHAAGRRAAAAAAGGAAAGAADGRPPVDETADKLDSLMELLLTHLRRRVAAGQLGIAWQTLLRAFEGALLHAHRCKFTQYLLFFLAVQDPGRCCPSFAACLVSVLRDARQPALTRCACAAYLASFLARCAPAPPALVVDVLHKLAGVACEYAEAALAAASGALPVANDGVPRAANTSILLMLGSDSGATLLGAGPLNAAAGPAAGGGAGGNAAAQQGGGAAAGSSGGALAAIQRHQVFYGTMQALLYLLCYHMQPLVQAAQAQGQAEQQNGFSHAQPLQQLPQLPPAAQAACSAAQQQQQQQLLQQQQEQQQQQPWWQEQLQPQQPDWQALASAVVTLVRQRVLPLLSHPLAPLAVCHQAVTSEFVRQAALLGLVDGAWEAAAVAAVAQHGAALAAATAAATVLLSPPGGDASAAAAAAAAGDGNAAEPGDAADDQQQQSGPRVLRPLEVFFPFDPYLLRRSAHFLDLPHTYTLFSQGHPHVAAAGPPDSLELEAEGGYQPAGDEAEQLQLRLLQQQQQQLPQQLEQEEEQDEEEQAGARRGASRSSGGDDTSSDDEGDGEGLGLGRPGPPSRPAGARSGRSSSSSDSDSELEDAAGSSVPSSGGGGGQSAAAAAVAAAAAAVAGTAAGPGPAPAAAPAGTPAAAAAAAGGAAAGGDAAAAAPRRKAGRDGSSKNGSGGSSSSKRRAGRLQPLFGDAAEPAPPPAGAAAAQRARAMLGLPVASPPADMMATSLGPGSGAARSYLAVAAAAGAAATAAAAGRPAAGAGPGRAAAAAAGVRPQQWSVVFGTAGAGGAGGRPGAGGSGSGPLGGSPLLGSSPMPMSITPCEGGGYMANLPAALGAAAALRGPGVVQ